MKEHIVGRQLGEHFVDVAAFVECLAVEVGIFVGEFAQQACVCHLYVVFGDSGGVGWHEDIGDDTAAAVYGAACCGVEYQSAVYLEAVGREYLASVVAVEDFGLVFTCVAGLVGLLYAASRRGVVALHGESELA